MAGISSHRYRSHRTDHTVVNELTGLSPTRHRPRMGESKSGSVGQDVRRPRRRRRVIAARVAAASVFCVCRVGRSELDEHLSLRMNQALDLSCVSAATASRQHSPQIELRQSTMST